MVKARAMDTMTVEEVRHGLQETRTVILPVGCVEQHGYHLPLSVDIHNAVEIALRASALTGCFVAPALSYSFSGGMLLGTINISPQLFSLLVMEICHSLIGQGFRNVVILLGHGGTENTRAAYEAAENFQRLNPQLGGITISVVPFWELSPTFMRLLGQGEFHASLAETSLMLFWKPELVKMDKARLDSDELAAAMRTDQDAYLTRHKEVDHPYVVPKLTQHPDMEVGVMGTYEQASAALGKTMAEEAVQGLVAFIGTLDRRHSA